MDEVRQSYYETQAARNAIKNSAYHKKNGSAVAKLGNKQDSWQDIVEKHGPVVTYPSTDNLMSYQDFVRLPNDLKVEFVNKICDKYDIDIKHVSRFLFNKGDDGLRAHLRNNKILQQCNPQKQRAKSGLLQFQEDVKEWKRRDQIAKEIDAEEQRRKQESLPSFITCDAFKKMPMEDRVAYINSVIETYQVSARLISVVLFEKSENWIANHFGRFNHNKEIVKLPQKLIVNKEQMFENERRFRKSVEAWREFGEEPIEEEPVKVSEDTMVKKMSEDKTFELECIEEKPEVKVEATNTLPPMAVDISEEDNRTQTIKIESEMPEAIINEEPDLMEYHEAHFSISYIRKGVNMDELAVIADLLKGKRVKVSIDIAEV